jgi:hypothetical protein
MGKAQTQSGEKRLHRFFRDFELDYRDIAKLVAGMMDNCNRASSNTSNSAAPSIASSSNKLPNTAGSSKGNAE